MGQNSLIFLIEFGDAKGLAAEELSLLAQRLPDRVDRCFDS